jgi:hypothetical protein
MARDNPNRTYFRRLVIAAAALKVLPATILIRLIHIVDLISHATKTISEPVIVFDLSFADASLKYTSVQFLNYRRGITHFQINREQRFQC